MLRKWHSFGGQFAKKPIEPSRKGDGIEFVAFELKEERSFREHLQV